MMTFLYSLKAHEKFSFHCGQLLYSRLPMTTKTAIPQQNLLKTFREFTKGGIVSLVLISVLSGYFLGHPLEKKLDWFRFSITFIGIFFLASGSSGWNQISEAIIDAKMPRTQNRPLPSGRITPTQAKLLATTLLIIGASCLFFLSRSLFIFGLFAVLSYNFLYTLWWKPRWAHAAIPGAIPGALPILMGHLSSSGHPFDPAGWYLFFILFFWQMPHFWSLAIRFKKDYQLGNIPTLPVSQGEETTVQEIAVWSLGYIALLLIGPLFLHVGAFYMGASVLIGVKILFELKRFSTKDLEKSWLRFFLWVNFSLILILAAALIDYWGIYLWIPLTQ
ncbi:MAG: protoheme IX farnesyltransferase [Bdellovibrionaceae bacterium]|nr:protoheme IX farnesyltransferase [Pseudobdellovibrionaceae bacterium]|tara:strand:+ start:2967 stop:3965 length:999 start_codon:yes stop_codon:yes gene_type:complete